MQQRDRKHLSFGNWRVHIVDAYLTTFSEYSKPPNYIAVWIITLSQHTDPVLLELLQLTRATSTRRIWHTIFQIT
jgi:hypothetical protein